MHTKNPFFVKIIALTVALTFSAQSIAVSSSVPSYITTPANSSQFDSFSLAELIEFFESVRINDNLPGPLIPSALGNVKTVFSPDEKTDNAPAPRIIYIQDAHASIDAQKNTEQILEYLSTGRKFSFVIAAEGSAGPLDVNLFNWFQEYPKINELILKDLADKGEITGAELFAHHHNEIEIYGAESPQLYRDNLKEFHIALKAFRRHESKLKQLADWLALQKKKTFNSDLFLLSQNQEAFHHGEMDLARYLSTLKKLAAKHLEIDLASNQKQFEYPNLVRIEKLRHEENKIDEKKALDEAAKLKSVILEKVSETNIRTHLRQKLNELTAAAQAGTSPEDLRRTFELIFVASQVFKFSLVPFQNFIRYGRALVFHSEINSTGTFDEIADLEKKLEHTLVKTEDENRVLKFASGLRLITKMYQLELSRSEFEQYLKEKDVIRTFLSQTEISLPMPRWAERFYRHALKRDIALVENALRMSSGKPTVLIAGGFHSEGIESILKAKGISFWTVAPNISEVNEIRADYLRVMEGQNTFAKSSEITSSIPDTLLSTPPQVYESLRRLDRGKQGRLFINQIRNQGGSLQKIYGLTKEQANAQVHQALKPWQQNPEARSELRSKRAEKIRNWVWLQPRQDVTKFVKAAPQIWTDFLGWRVWKILASIWNRWKKIPDWKITFSALLLDQVAKKISFFFGSPFEQPAGSRLLHLFNTTPMTFTPGVSFVIETAVTFLMLDYLLLRFGKETALAKGKWSALFIGAFLSNVLEARLTGGAVDFLLDSIFLRALVNFSDEFQVAAMIGFSLHAVFLMSAHIVSKTFWVNLFSRNTFHYFQNKAALVLEKLRHLQTYKQIAISAAKLAGIGLAALTLVFVVARAIEPSHYISAQKYEYKSEPERIRWAIDEYAVSNRRGAHQILQWEIESGKSLYEIYLALLDAHKQALEKDGFKYDRWTDQNGIKHEVLLDNARVIGSLFQALLKNSPSSDIYIFLKQLNSNQTSVTSKLFRLAALEELFSRGERDNPRFQSVLSDFLSMLSSLFGSDEAAELLAHLFESFKNTDEIIFYYNQSLLDEFFLFLNAELEHQAAAKPASRSELRQFELQSKPIALITTSALPSGTAMSELRSASPKLRSTTQNSLRIAYLTALAWFGGLLPIGILPLKKYDNPEFSSVDYLQARELLSRAQHKIGKKRAAQYWNGFFEAPVSSALESIALTSDVLTPEVVDAVNQIGLNPNTKITVYDLGDSPVLIRSIRHASVIPVSRSQLRIKINNFLEQNEKIGALSHTAIWTTHYEGINRKGLQFIANPNRFEDRNLRGASLLLEFLLVQLAVRLGKVLQDRLEYTVRTDGRIEFSLTAELVSQISWAHRQLTAILHFA